MRPLISLVVPTRGRPAQLRRMLDSVARTGAHPERIEVVLVVDSDDNASLVAHPRLSIRHVVVPPGRSMGAVQTAVKQSACDSASAGAVNESSDRAICA